MLEELSKILRIQKADLMKAIGLDPVTQDIKKIEGTSIEDDIIIEVITKDK